MNIDYVIVATDNNPEYDGFWQIIKDAWNNVIGVTPILVIIGEENFIKEEENCIIVGYKKVKNIETSFQSQVARLYATSLYEHKTYLTSDIDMLPMLKSYFLNNANNAKDDQIVIYTSDAYGYYRQTRYPMCYNLAMGSTYKEILKLNCSYYEFIERLDSFDIQHNRKWDTDELYIGKCVRDFEIDNEHRIIKLSRGFREGYATDRLDRDYWNRYDFNKITQDAYIDCHFPRPYNREENKKSIDNILRLLYQK